MVHFECAETRPLHHVMVQFVGICALEVHHVMVRYAVAE